MIKNKVLASKKSLGLVVSKYRKAQKGTYHYWLKDAELPAIGGPTTAAGLTVVGGYLYGNHVAQLNPVPTINLANTSLVIALRYVISDASTFALYGEPAGPNVGIFPGTTTSSVNGFSDDNFVPAFIPAMAFPAAGPTEHSLVLAYDSAIDKALLYLDGVLGPVDGFTTPMGIATPDTLNISQSVVSTANKFRDLSLISFPGRLPSDFDALVASYHANPLTKLSAWAN